MTFPNGSTPVLPRLGRVPHFDPRSRNYPIRALFGAAVQPRSYTWSCGVTLDQGQVPACVGFSWAAELAARPVVVSGVTNPLGLSLYHQAQTLDPWPGEDYDGTAVIGGAKAVQARGFLAEYRWAFGIEEALVAISRQGPAVLGLNWHDGMYYPDSKGVIRPTGVYVGGHALLAIGYNVTSGLVRLHNSWGPGWGLNGQAFMHRNDLATLLAAEGECCVPVKRLAGGL